MLTLFTVPKPFAGHIGVIQRNALGSWARLGHGCETIVFGDENGSAEAAAEVGARHVATVACNERGTPLVNDVFAQAEQLARHDVLVYANADMILFDDLFEAVRRVRGHVHFLLCGRRWNFDLDSPLSYESGWAARLRGEVLRRGRLAIPGAIDYFAFRRGFLGEMPPFAIGRVDWDQWLLFRARTRGAILIDATATVIAAHQNHDYRHLTAAPRAEIREEIARNRDLASFHRLDLRDATHLLTAGDLVPALDAEHRRRRAMSLLKFYLPATPAVRSAYRWWRRRVRGLPPSGGIA